MADVRVYDGVVELELRNLRGVAVSAKEISGSGSIPGVRIQARKQAVNPWLIAVTVTLVTFMELLDTAITNVSLPTFAGGLATSYDESTWVAMVFVPLRQLQILKQTDRSQIF